MVTISLCMIVKNEEAVLGRCLDCVKDVVDEIIIVDTGSTDSTKNIAGQYTSRIYDFPWQDDFSAARNASFSHATQDYILWLDADDILEPEQAIKLQRLKETLPQDTDVVMMRYHTAFDSQNRPTYSYFRERLLRNHAGFRWVGAVHEAIPTKGNIRYEEIAVSHRKLAQPDSMRNLRIFEKMLRQPKGLDTRQQFYYGRELCFHEQYERAAQVLGAFLEQPDAWVENKIEACRLLSTCRRAAGQPRQALMHLFQSFLYDTPRAEICCAIGSHFFEDSQWEPAAFWYSTALTCTRRDLQGGFIQEDCYGYLPCLQLCVCYDRMGQWKLAAQYNEQAAAYKPGDPLVEQNRLYFCSRLNSQVTATDSAGGER